MHLSGSINRAGEGWEGEGENKIDRWIGFNGTRARKTESIVWNELDVLLFFVRKSVHL